MTETPKYVTAGIDFLDELISRRIYGVREETRYGSAYLPYDYFATSNTGMVHDLPGAPFTMRAYSWADCDCGFEEAEWTWCKENEHEAGCYQEIRKARGLVPWGDTKHSFREKEDINSKITKEVCEEIGLDPVFGSEVHCTCSYEQRWKEFMSKNGHTATCTPEIPNFSHPGSGLEVRWYKHSRRGTECNKAMGFDEWRTVQRECEDWVLSQSPRKPH